MRRPLQQSEPAIVSSSSPTPFFQLMVASGPHPATAAADLIVEYSAASIGHNFECRSKIE
jgi:hypothetical protein